MNHIVASAGNLEDGELNEIYKFIKETMDLDFTYYKQNIVQQRIERRMDIHHIENLKEYYEFLKGFPGEVRALCEEICIGVTQFFRDPEAFEYIKEHVIPEIVERKSEGETIRIWVPGCSTGEEVYSVAILFQDYLKKLGKKQSVKIFASDINRNFIQAARAGIYNRNIEEDVPEALLEAYFIKSGEKYRVSREIRDMIIFTYHNIIKDPPFNKMDLITCRNLLIYFQAVLQRKVLTLFKFSLNYDGYLVLGPSETLGELSTAFIPLEHRWRIFKYKEISNISNFENTSLTSLSSKKINIEEYESFNPNLTYQSICNIYRFLFQKKTGPVVVVDEQYNVILVFGKAGQYLNRDKEKFSSSIIDLVERAMAVLLAMALRRAFVQNEKTFCLYDIQTMDTQIKRIKIIVELLPELEGFPKIAAIYFEDPQGEKEAAQVSLEIDMNEMVKESEREAWNESLQVTLEELEVSNEELQAANGELSSSNEELQAVNEELVILNSEYKLKISELGELSNDINNLLLTTKIGVIYLDVNLNIRKFANTEEKSINIGRQDIGKSIAQVAHNLLDIDILEDSAKVLKTLEPIEKKVKSLEGDVYLMKIYPYRSKDSNIRGIIMTFVNITGCVKL